MRVKKLGSGSLSWGAGTISGGEVGDVPADVVRRYAHKFRILEPTPRPKPIRVTPDISGLSVTAVLDAVDDGRIAAAAALEAERAGRARVTLIRELEARAGAGEE